ncbi:MAG: hypothetical protein ACJAT3_000919, partial [Akkermansiaceae bacterium]
MPIRALFFLLLGFPLFAEGPHYKFQIRASKID